MPDIIEVIDEVLDDWEYGPDAAHWSATAASAQDGPAIAAARSRIVSPAEALRRLREWQNGYLFRSPITGDATPDSSLHQNQTLTITDSGQSTRYRVIEVEPSNLGTHVYSYKLERVSDNA